jgi:hypothetical protein
MAKSYRRGNGGRIMSSYSIDYRSEAREASYGVAVCIDVVVLYVVNHLLDWHVPFITLAFADVLWALNLSLGTAIVINATFIPFDRAWWRRLGRAAMDSAALLSTYILFAVFPFAFPSAWMTGLVALMLVLLIVAVAISVVVHVVQFVAELAR